MPGKFIEISDKGSTNRVYLWKQEWGIVDLITYDDSTSVASVFVFSESDRFYSPRKYIDG